MIRGTYTYICDLCGKYHLGEPWDSPIRGSQLNPSPPPLWITIGPRLICDKHDITTTTLAEGLGFPLEDRVEFKPVENIGAAEPS